MDSRFETLSREDLIAECQTMHEHIVQLEEVNSQINSRHSKAIENEKEKSRLEKEILERAALEIASAVGELSEEKAKIEKEKVLIENSTYEIIKDLSELSQSSSSVDDEKKELEKHFNLKLDIFNEKISRTETDKEDLKRQLSRLAGQYQAFKTSCQKIISKIYPEEIGQEIILDRENFRAHNISVLAVYIADYHKLCADINYLKLARSIKNLYTEINKIVNRSKGWILHFSGGIFYIAFGVPFESSSHFLEAAQGAVDISRLAGNTEFSTYACLHAAEFAIGDIGSPWRPQYGIVGDGLDVFHSPEFQNAALDGKILVTAQVCEKIRSFFNIQEANCPVPKTQRFFALKPYNSVLENPFRIQSTCRLYVKYRYFIDDIQKVYDQFLAKWNIKSIEIKDGSLGQGEAIAYYALSLAAEAGLKTSNEELIKAAFLLNSGKFYYNRSLLMKPVLNTKEKEVFKQLYTWSAKLASRLPDCRKTAEIISEMQKTPAEMKHPESKALKIASQFEGISFPKLYKTRHIS
ncbi:MAG TPA: hypothetical protein DC049_14745, partial [Spirochaetia bacterium]|nr:hypothetical protein [Spirochaetia bacterium]